MTSPEPWTWPTEYNLGSDLAAMRLGLVGNGRIGRAMARMANGFRMKLLCFDPYVSASDMRAQNIEKVNSIDELCSRVDALSIHCVRNDETEGLLTEQHIARLPSHALVVNVSRGEIVDEHALVAAVQRGELGGIGIDVFRREPLERGSDHVFEPLLDRDDCIFTPHLAFWTKEALHRLETEALERCIEALDGRPLRVLSDDPRLRSQSSPGLVVFD